MSRGRVLRGRIVICIVLGPFQSQQDCRLVLGNHIALLFSFWSQQLPAIVHLVLYLQLRGKSTAKRSSYEIFSFWVVLFCDSFVVVIFMWQCTQFELQWSLIKHWNKKSVGVSHWKSKSAGVLPDRGEQPLSSKETFFHPSLCQRNLLGAAKDI